jgi:hypothetical protein
VEIQGINLNVLLVKAGIAVEISYSTAPEKDDVAAGVELLAGMQEKLEPEGIMLGA